MENTLPIPTPNPDSAVYWEAAKNSQLLIRRCKDCKAFHFMPRHLCPTCWSDSLEWVEASGKGTVHSFTIIRRAPLKIFASQVPYVVALIELEEGVRMLTNVVGGGALDVQIGDPVRVTFESRGEGSKVPQFQRVAR